MTTLQLKRIRDDYLSGKQPKEIAFDNNVHQSTIYRLVKDIKFKYRNWALIETVSKDYFSGKYTKKEICDKYHICRNTLCNYIKRYRSAV